MLLRVLVIALWCASASALTPLSAAGDDNDCALYLTGPGRTSAYDYSLNLLRGNFGYDGQHTCITYDAVNQAYLDARKRILVSQPKGDWKPEDFASVGELVLDISINLAKTYGLTYEEIEKGLPLIDTSRTLIREVCPPVFSHVECRAGKYRRLDGLCNNLQNPNWGATNAPFQRLIGPLFSDGINSPRISHTGRDLPLSRVVSRTMHPDHGFHDHAGTVMVIAWGQFMDHDYTLTGTPLDPRNRNDPEECCKRPPHLKHPYCNEIRVPDDDYFYRLFGINCIDFVRGFPSPRPGCRLGSRVPFNTLTGVIDGNTVYGVTEKFARKLRTGYGGLLRMNPVFKEYGLKDILPLKLDIPDEGCTRPNKNMYCFEAGEIRVNEQLVLTVMHTLMAREHNRVAQGLAAVNPHWDDETLYQEARRINIAEIQHITYNEFLPILLGKDVMEKFGLVVEKEGYWDGYDPHVNADVIDAFAAAAYRFGHSLLPTAVERWSKAHKFIASKRLSDLIRRPYDLYRAGVLDEYVMGLMNQVAQAMDDSITQEVTNHLFKKVGARFGMDLVSFNMQRGREFGLPGYMEFRKFCGLSGADTFQELFGSMPNETVRKYESIFEHPIDVDLWSGGVSERPLPGSMLGPTFACVIATQFSYSRRGDRFWYELRDQPSSFTPEQLQEVRKARLARVICDNTDIIDTVQLYPMVLPDHELNPRVPCKSGIIPSIDFSKWAEPAPFAGNAKQFITDAVYASGNDSDSLDLGNNTTQNTTHLINGQELCNESSININANLQLPVKMKITSTDSNQTVNTENDQTITGDTIAKYVYKDNEKADVQKDKGHKANSLNRRKRYAEKDVTKLPLIVNYETTHSREPLEQPAGNFIQGSALADFNIETLHGDVKIPQDKLAHKEPEHRVSPNKDNARPSVSVEDRSSSSAESDSSTEVGDDSREVSKENIKSNESSEEHNESPRANKRFNDDSSSVEVSKNYDNDYQKPKDNIREKQSSAESVDRDDKTYSNKAALQENSESVEQFESSREENRKPDPKNKNLSNIEKYDDSKEKRYENDNNQQSHSNEDEESRESKEEKNKHENYSDKSKLKKHYDEENSNEKDNTGRKIQDVDLGDFSYERIHVNKKGEVEPANDNHYEKHSSDEDAPSNEKEEGKNSKYSGQTIKINDGEVKPVVEISNESKESSDESTETNNENLKEDKSLESLLNASGNEDDRKAENIKQIQSNDKADNVKQEFERIPLDYNHDKNNNDDSPNVESYNDDKKLKSVEGDKAAPEKEDNYDEKLHFKFDDVRVKLPEIKLPEDILAFNHKEPIKKTTFFHSNDEDDEDEKDEVHDHKHGHEDEHDYFDPYANKQTRHPKKSDKYEKENDDVDENEESDEEDEDLYEKFVRERFGKKNTFQQRSEKLQQQRYLPENSQLYETLGKILKKTEETSKQAEKSGDPNAGYAWTLEYGQQFV